MAKETNEISDLVKKCKILLLDIEGTTTSISFVKDKLFPYAEENVKRFLESQWEDEDVKAAVSALRKQAAEDQEKGVDGLVVIPGEDASKDELIEGLVKNIKWQMSEDRKIGALKQLQGLIWKEGYNKGDIKGHVYDDVPPALELWRSTKGQKVYIYSSGSVQAQKLLFQKSLAGDMLPLMDGHFDTAVGAKQDAASYAAIAEKIGCKAEEILFLTDIDKEAEAARSSGVHAALVSREGNTPLLAEATASFPVLHSFEQLALTNKRKTDPQVEEVPAKVPKTDVQEDVKTASEIETETGKANSSTESSKAMETAVVLEKTEEPETMEVEETPDATAKKTQIEELAAITEKDVPMEDAGVHYPTVVEENAAVETTVAKADCTENTDSLSTTAEPVADDDSCKTIDEKNASTKKDKAENSTTEVTVVAPRALESKDEEVLAKAEAKAKMVDAATLTDDSAVEKPAVEIKKVDAATETATVEQPPKKSNSEKSFVEEMKVEPPVNEPKTVETPAVEAAVADEIVKQTSVGSPAKDTTDLLTEPKDVENPLTAHAEESNKVEADTAKSTTTADSKAEEPIVVKIKPVDTTDVEDSEANTKEANGTDDKDTKAITSDNSTGFSSSAPIESVKNLETVDKHEEMALEVVVDVTDQKNAVDAPTIKIDSVIEEIGEKTESNETAVKVNEEKVETVTEPKEPIENPQVEAVMKETPFSVEIKDITDDKQSLGEVADIIDDVVPIVEEPSSNLEEMEELQNAGDVLEQECDEILSKVQDVTNLDYMQAKPLHTISEEMETESMDTNDIVEGILDTEMELSMKPEDIDLNTVQEITEPKSDSDERIGKAEPGTEKPSETSKVEDFTEERMEVSCDSEMVTEKINKNKLNPDANETTLEPNEEKMETEEVAEPEAEVELENKVEAGKYPQPEECKKHTDVPIVVETAAQTDDSEQKSENKESDKTSDVTQEVERNDPQDNKTVDATEPKVNGKTNGDANVKLNGNSNKDNDLKSRLTAEKGKEKVNGSNGDSANAEIGQGDNKVEAETPDLKVKTVATDEVPAQKEQPVEG